jgi:hypothetical protein
VIKVNKPSLKLLLAILLLTFTACGGGGGGGDATPSGDEQAVVSLTLTGGVEDTIGSIEFELILPEGFSLATDGDELAEGVLSVSVAGSTVVTNYLPEDSENLGQLNFTLIKDTGFSADDFVATLVHDLVQGEAIPSDTSFTVSELEVTNGGEDLGYSLSISVQQQAVTP